LLYSLCWDVFYTEGFILKIWLTRKVGKKS
jgi:hypothetical protein